MKKCTILTICPHLLILGREVCGTCPGIATNLRLDCRECSGLLRAITGPDRYSVECCQCGYVEVGRDYLARCVGGAPLGKGGAS